MSHGLKERKLYAKFVYKPSLPDLVNTSVGSVKKDFLFGGHLFFLTKEL